MKLNEIFEKETYKKLATSTALVAAMTASGCASMDPYDSGRLGGAVGGAVGVGLSEALQSAAGGDETARIVRGIGLGYLGSEAGTAIGKGMGGNCDRDVVIDNRTRTVTRDTSRCDINHRTPSGTPTVVYPK